MRQRGGDLLRRAKAPGHSGAEISVEAQSQELIQTRLSTRVVSGEEYDWLQRRELEGFCLGVFFVIYLT